ncbi:hypothetical protein A3A03_02295 [Candidatus Nomurabacteria bacterium RIFCSPLOWO2_01_FULL_40_18]|uniref:Uncharacterized protein n=1 Tax=Candidatus Nomurabacteria bacterium RIFCSPLOWO2_01_FULL_40_18 TaxID=1801773 RepID=A0A1F6XK39_9BACT|nr:MAG: hypothetical protein A3A03_02295 [Candidatus Nomurabacteria bacterium RIFCSPLOWO2_01_FULL_40_18]
MGLGAFACQASVNVNNSGDDGKPGKIISYTEWATVPGNTSERADFLRGGNRRDSLEPLNSFTLGQNGIVIHSGPALNSPSVNAHRGNTMGGLVGASVPMDRVANPVAFYPTLQRGLQSFDYVTTTFPSWMGSTNNVPTGQLGHREIISCAGASPVSSYVCHIVSTDTNIGSATFGVATNGSGAELTFSSTYVGINFGANGVLNSFYDPAQGAWVQAGDDTVFVGGQLPSAVMYHVWYRFGATVSVIITAPSGFNAVNGQFASADQWLTAQLFKSGVLMASRTVTEAVPSLTIMKETNVGPSPMRLALGGGQLRVPYTILGASQVSGPWTSAYGQAIFSSDTPVTLPNNIPIRFFRTQKGF